VIEQRDSIPEADEQNGDNEKSGINPKKNQFST